MDIITTYSLDDLKDITGNYCDYFTLDPTLDKSLGTQEVFYAHKDNWVLMGYVNNSDDVMTLCNFCARKQYGYAPYTGTETMRYSQVIGHLDNPDLALTIYTCLGASEALEDFLKTFTLIPMIH